MSDREARAALPPDQAHVAAMRETLTDAQVEAISQRASISSGPQFWTPHEVLAVCRDLLEARAENERLRERLGQYENPATNALTDVPLDRQIYALQAWLATSRAEAAGLRERLLATARDIDACAAHCERIAAADEGEVNGLRAEGSAGAHRDDARAIRAALSSEPPAAEEPR
jgi:hypothetical protein